MNIGRILSTAQRRAIGGLLLLAVVLTACGGGGSESWAGVAAGSDPDTIYLAYERRVAAVNPIDGAVKWTYDYDDIYFFAVPTVADDILYIGDYQGQLHAINVENGEALWVYTPERKMLIGPLALEAKDRVIGGVGVGPEHVYFGLGSRNVVAVSRETGEKAWTFETDHGVWAQPLYLPADPELGRDADMLYVVSLDHHLYAIAPETGDQLWKKDLGGAAPGNPVYDAARNRVYVGTFISEMIAVDLSTREIVARYETEDWLWGAPAFEDDVLYFGDLSGNLYAVRATDEGFAEVWRRDELAEGAIRATPLITGDTVVAGSKDEHIYAVNKESGANRWYKKTEGEALTNLVFVPEVAVDDESTVDWVVVGTDDSDNLLIAYDIENGERSWRYKH